MSHFSLAKPTSYDMTYHLWFWLWLQQAAKQTTKVMKKVKKKVWHLFFYCHISSLFVQWCEDYLIFGSRHLHLILTVWLLTAKCALPNIHIYILLSLSMLFLFSWKLWFWWFEVERKRNGWKWNESELEHNIFLIHAFFWSFPRYALNCKKQSLERKGM